MEQTDGYGEDPYCAAAADLIRKKCRAENADVHFMVGGTQTNLTVIAACLRPHQGAVCAVTGHINTHESGAIEATGHKVLPLPSADGKLTARQLEALVAAHENDPSREHTVQPKLVYLSNPTELGTIYTKSELTTVSEVCRKLGLILYVDGARLGYALQAGGGDLDLPDLARLCDVFYIGGTKVGALFGEALVITNGALKPDFRYIVKQRGGLLAKGRLLGLQFQVLFEDRLYDDISVHADRMAEVIRRACAEKGFAFVTASPTNQQFPILPDALLDRLKPDFEYTFWQKTDAAHTAVRLCTSWATTFTAIDALATAIRGF